MDRKELSLRYGSRHRFSAVIDGQHSQRGERRRQLRNARLGRRCPCLRSEIWFHQTVVSKVTSNLDESANPQRSGSRMVKITTIRNQRSQHPKWTGDPRNLRLNLPQSTTVLVPTTKEGDVSDLDERFSYSLAGSYLIFTLTVGKSDASHASKSRNCQL